MSHKGPDVWGNDLAELNDRIRKHREYFEQHRQEVANNIQKDPRAHVLVRNYADSQRNEAENVLSSALSRQTDSGNIQAVTEPELEFYGNTDTEGAAPIVMADNGGIVSDGQNADMITQKYDILVNGFHGTPEDLFTWKHPELFKGIVEHWMQLSPNPTAKFKQMVHDYVLAQTGKELSQGFRLYNDMSNNAFKVQNAEWKVLFTLNDAPVAVTKHESGVDVSADWWHENQDLQLEPDEESETSPSVREQDGQRIREAGDKSPELSEGAKSYYDMLHEAKDKLVDTSTFMSPQADAILKQYVGDASGVLHRTEWRGDNANTANYTVTLNGEQWNLTEVLWDMGQFPNGLPNKLRHLILWSPDKEKQIEFPIGEVFSQNGNINVQALQHQVQKANNAERMESADNAHATRFDLPKDRPIGYIGLIQSSSDGTVDTVRNDMQYFPELLQSQWYDIQSKEPFALVNQGDSPRDMIQQQINAFRTQWTKEIYLNLSGHGTREHISFGKGPNAPKLNHAEFQSLITQNPDMNFTVNSVACFGWGLLNQDLRTGWDAQEVRVFAQTKTDAYNQGGEFNDGRGDQSTYYNIFFQDALRSGATYGQAHRIADHESQIRSGSNATMVSVDRQWERVTA